MPSETTVLHESRHGLKQVYNLERNQSDRHTRASTTSNGVVSAAVPHVPEVTTIARFSKCSINKSPTTEKKNRRNQTGHKQRARVRVHTWARGRSRSFDGANRWKECTLHTACNTHGRTCTDNDTLVNGHRADVRRPEPQARVPSKQATRAPRTKTGDFKMDNQRQEPQTMNHLKSRTKPPDTRPNLNHRCKSMSRTENHVPVIIANTTTGHATRPPT